MMDYNKRGYSIRVSVPAHCIVSFVGFVCLSLWGVTVDTVSVRDVLFCRIKVHS
jgi:hypothetical protein